jgi:toxin ParE1/3/4
VHVELHAEAVIELAEAIDWYDARLAGLGDDFEREVWKAVSRIAALPHAWSPWRYDPQYRFARTKRFPYMLPYVIEGSEALVLAVAHERRQSGYWLVRAPTSP